MVSVAFAALPQRLRRDAGRYPQPVDLLTRLGVDGTNAMKATASVRPCGIRCGVHYGLTSRGQSRPVEGRAALAPFHHCRHFPRRWSRGAGGPAMEAARTRVRRA